MNLIDFVEKFDQWCKKCIILWRFKDSEQLWCYFWLKGFYSCRRGRLHPTASQSLNLAGNKDINSEFLKENFIILCHLCVWASRRIDASQRNPLHGRRSFHLQIKFSFYAHEKQRSCCYALPGYPVFLSFFVLLVSLTSAWRFWFSLFVFCSGQKLLSWFCTSWPASVLVVDDFLNDWRVWSLSGHKVCSKGKKMKLKKDVELKINAEKWFQIFNFFQFQNNFSVSDLFLTFFCFSFEQTSWHQCSSVEDPQCVKMSNAVSDKKQ